MLDLIRKAAMVKPSQRQLAWQQMEFNGFIHFTINTFTDREWGLGDEDPAIFNPRELDTDQWVTVCKAAGMKGLILTCKHHDGFCLWPSQYTEHSVKSSPWRDGQGDLVREVAESCRRAGLKLGIYLSPWDRHEKTYGDSALYNEYYQKQLRELLTGYGEIFCVWLDGACGEGPNGKRQVYDWDGYYRVIRELQPRAVIAVCGPDIRWCGNEAGHCRKSEWSVVPAVLRDAEKVAERSQKEDTGEFSKRINSGDEDLGSREAIQSAGELVWYPAEVNTSIRPGWFYHAREDSQVKPAEELLELYYNSVGGNANLLLNIPPDPRGLIHENDAACLQRFGRALEDAFTLNLAQTALAVASDSFNQYEANNILDPNPDTFWRPREGTEAAWLEIDLNRKQTFDKIVLMEHIESSGQRVESFTLEIRGSHGWQTLYEGTVIGYKRICRFPCVTTRYLRLRINRSRWYPTITYLGVFGSKTPAQ